MSNNTTKHNEREYVERLSFYGDTDKEKNKSYCFDINSIFDLQARLIYWMKKVYVRAAWYQVVEKGVRIKNERIDLVHLLDFNDIVFMSDRNKSKEIKGHNPFVIDALINIYKNDGLSVDEIANKIKKDITNFKPDDLKTKLDAINRFNAMQQEIDKEMEELNEQIIETLMRIELSRKQL